jgi:hypothetical protein
VRTAVTRVILAQPNTLFVRLATPAVMKQSFGIARPSAPPPPGCAVLPQILGGDTKRAHLSIRTISPKILGEYRRQSGGEGVVSAGHEPRVERS